MEKITPAQEAILEVLDGEIDKLERKLAKVRPYFDELEKLKRTRMTLLSERSVTGGIRNGTRLTMESVIQVFRDSDKSVLNAQQIGTKLGVDPTVVRSHLNRYKDERYRQVERGEWELIGSEEEDD